MAPGTQIQEVDGPAAADGRRVSAAVQTEQCAAGNGGPGVSSALPREMHRMLAQGGVVGSLMVDRDWTSTPVGPMAGWPQSLRTALSVCLSSKFPMFVFWGPDMVQFYNDEFLPVLGGKHPTGLGQSARECWQETWDLVGPMLDGVMAGGEATYFDDLPVTLHRAGFTEECYFTFCYAPIHDESGQVAGIFGTVSETTGRVVGERRLQILRELSDTARMVDSADEVCADAAAVLSRHPTDVPYALLYLLHADGLSARLAAAAGLEAGHRLSPHTVELNGQADAWPLAAATDHPVEVTRPLPHLTREGFDPPSGAVVVPIRQAAQAQPAGFLVIGLSSGRPLDDDYRTFVNLAAGHISAAITDATAFAAERHRTEQLAALDRAKTAFFTNVSHEFRTPLSLLLGPVEDALATGREGMAPAGGAEVLEVVHRNALRLQKLVEGMLDFSRLEAGRMDVDLQATDLARFTTVLASQFSSAVEQAGLAMQIECPPLPGAVRVDREMWEKIVLNLLSNALKFTFEGSITVRLAAADGHAVLSVSDTGVGIPPAELPRLFERFHRVPGTRSRSHEGSGIGLALVEELVHLHGGQVTVESEEGVGTTFRVRLPAPAAPPVAVEPAREVRRARAFVEEALRWLPDPTGPEQFDDVPGVDGERASFDPATRIVVVDDNADLRDYLRRILGAHWTVEAHDNGAVALEAVTAAVPHLVVTDVMMPGLDGFGLVRALRDHPATRRVPIIMLSARAGDEAAVEGLVHGADDYLVKPFSSRELLARVRAKLELARLREAATRAAEGEARRLAGLTEAATSLGRCRSVGECRKVVVEAARSVVGANQAVAALTEEPTSDAAPTGIPARSPRAAGWGGPAGSPGGEIWPLPGQDGRPLRLTAQEFAAHPASKHWACDPDPPRRGLLAAPMLVPDHGPVGVIWLSDRGDGADFSADDEAVVVQLAQLAASRVEAIRALDREHRVAVTLQNALLPETPADLSGLTVATRYYPGAAGLEVGGDWYDVFPLPGRRLGVAVGDVVGRGVGAAAVMGQLRVALRAYALEFSCPAAVLACLSRLARSLDDSQMATVCYGVVDPDEARIVLASAGHPPPLLLRADGRAGFVDLDGAPPLGVLADVSPTQVEERLEPGSALLFYTDGLIERRDVPIEEGMAALADAAAGPADVEALCDRVTQALGADRSPDDVALLALSLAAPRASEPAADALQSSGGPAAQVAGADGVTVVALRGDIDISTVDEAKQALVGAATSGARGVVIDLTPVTFLDSSGVNVLFLMVRRFAQRQQAAAIVVPPRSLLGRILRVCALDQVVSIYCGIDEAVDAVRERLGSA